MRCPTCAAPLDGDPEYEREMHRTACRKIAAWERKAAVEKSLARQVREAIE